MKKTLGIGLVFGAIILSGQLFGASQVFADANSTPIVSIGIGNGNLPENTGPTHGAVYHGEIPVYATALDDDLDNYHFRVVKVGGSEGDSCDELGSLFAPENQGYASTTQNKEACGFAFNQSVYVSASGFTNSLIATLNTDSLIAFGGEGDYLLIIGAVDTAGHRTEVNYLNDPRVKITVSNTDPVTPPAPTPAPAPAPVSGGGSGSTGGNGPIANSYGFVNINPTSNSSSAASANTQNINPSGSMGNTRGNTVVQNQIAANPSFSPDSGVSVSGTSEVASENTESVPVVVNTSTDASQLALASASGWSYNWLWLALAIILVGGGTYYYYRLRD